MVDASFLPHFVRSLKQAPDQATMRCNRRKAIKTEGNNVKLNPEYKTVWHEIEVL